MRMIEVLDLMAKGEIKEGSKLKIGGNTYSYIDTYTDDSGYCSFVVWKENVILASLVFLKKTYEKVE